MHMVNPVNPFQSQSIPAANTFQPGGREKVERPPSEDRTAQRVENRAARVEATATRVEERRDDDRAFRAAAAEARYEDNGAASTSSSRGSSVDITV
jgi:hypothetical protein